MQRETSLPALSIENLSVNYGPASAVRDVTFQLAQGAIVTIIGPNGAGKTTLLNAVAGLLPSTGSVRMQDQSLSGMTTSERVLRGLTIVPEQRDLFTTMSVEDNLQLGAFTRRRDRTEVSSRLKEVLALFPKLGERRMQLVGTMSGGERQMLAVGRALMSCPKVLLLDEPSLGLAPLIVADMFRAIARLRELGVSTLVVEQNARMALRYADYGYVLENGTIVMEGERRQLLGDPNLIKSYLGIGRH